MPEDIILPEEIEVTSQIFLSLRDLEILEEQGRIVISSYAQQTINGIPVKVTNEIKVKGE